MSDFAAEAEAAWAEHVAECTVCSFALARDEPLFGPGCSEYEGGPIEPEPILTPDEDICECCNEVIPAGEERHLIYGAVWCASCADDPDQYDEPGDYKEQRGVVSEATRTNIGERWADPEPAD